MLFYSFFKTLIGQEILVELKNDIILKGKLVSVDQYLNIKLDPVQVVQEGQHPQFMSIVDCFIRGPVIRYISMAPEAVDTDLLQDATRAEATSQA